MSTYLETTREVYREAALAPQASLCCSTSKPMALPGLVIPEEMSEMNYGCGTTVHLQDLNPDTNVLYVGVGGGMEALQFAYFTRRPGSVIAVDSVPEMLEKAKENFEIAAEVNPWFDPSFVDLLEGDALDLPVPDASVDLAAQKLSVQHIRAGRPETGAQRDAACSEPRWSAFDFGSHCGTTDPGSSEIG